MISLLRFVVDIESKRLSQWQKSRFSLQGTVDFCHSIHQRRVLAIFVLKALTIGDEKCDVSLISFKYDLDLLLFLLLLAIKSTV